MRSKLRAGLLLTAYTLLSSGGLLALLVAPTRSLAEQGGTVTVVVWSVLCLLGGGAGAVGVLGQRPVVEIFGAVLGLTATTAWVVALVLQAIATGDPLPATAACMVAMAPVLLARRWAEVRRM